MKTRVLLLGAVGVAIAAILVIGLARAPADGNDPEGDAVARAAVALPAGTWIERSPLQPPVPPESSDVPRAEPPRGGDDGPVLAPRRPLPSPVTEDAEGDFIVVEERMPPKPPLDRRSFPGPTYWKPSSRQAKLEVDRLRLPMTADEAARDARVLRRVPIGDSTEIQPPWRRLNTPGEDQRYGPPPVDAPDDDALPVVVEPKRASTIDVSLSVVVPAVDDAEVVVNRRAVGLAPVTVDLDLPSPGDLWIQVSKEGHATVTRSIRLGRDHPGGPLELMIDLPLDLPRVEDPEAPPPVPNEPEASGPSSTGPEDESTGVDK